MFTARRGAFAPWLLPLALVLAGCGGPEEAVRGCSSDAECGPGALCLQSACVTNRPPAVTLQLPAGLSTHRVVFLSARATDPDPGDTIAGLLWTITPVGAACGADPEPASGTQLELVFWCAGTYEVAVVAEDRQGGRSAPARQLVDVAATSGAPVVTAGPDLAVEHACGGTPFACRPALAGSLVPLPLSAVVSDPAGGALGTRWRMIPPGGADPGATVAYARGETSLVTEAWLETPGGLMAGSWRFRLRATSAAGLVGQAEQRVQIGNRPPVIGADPFRLEHRYQGGGWQAGGTLALPATDPDGDPLTLDVSLVEAGTLGCTTHLGPVVAGGVAFDTRCAEATRLIGQASRGLRVVATDGSGATAEVTVPIEILNRPPVLRLASDPAGGLVSVGHTVGDCPAGGGRCFLATGTASFDVVDPDGDPVTSPAVAAVFPSPPSSSSGEATTAAGVATFRFATALSAPGEFRATDGRSPFGLRATAADAFGASSALAVPVVIGNRPPVLRRAAATVTVPHRYDPAQGAYLASAPLAGFEDPDGDPLLTDGSAGDGLCKAFSFTAGDGWLDCRLPYAVAPGLPPLALLVKDHPVVLRAFDGWEGTSSATLVSVQDGAPTLAVAPVPIQSCQCACAAWSTEAPECLLWLWQAPRRSIPLPMTLADADGDPVLVTYSPAPARGAQQTAFPAACGASYDLPVGPLQVQVTVDDGVSRAQASILLDVACSREDQACTP